MTTPKFSSWKVSRLWDQPFQFFLAKNANKIHIFHLTNIYGKMLVVFPLFKKGSPFFCSKMSTKKSLLCFLKSGILFLLRLSPPIVQTKVRSDYTPNVNTKVRVVVYYLLRVFFPKKIIVLLGYLYFQKWTKVDLIIGNDQLFSR